MEPHCKRCGQPAEPLNEEETDLSKCCQGEICDGDGSACCDYYTDDYWDDFCADERGDDWEDDFIDGRDYIPNGAQ